MDELTNMRNCLGWVCVAVVAMACQKDQVDDHVLDEPVGATKASLRRLFVNDLGDGVKVYFCHADNGNCLPDFVVRPPGHIAVINDVFAAVWSQVQSAIVSTFAANRHVLLEFVDEADVNRVISGELKAQAGEGDDGGRFLFICDAQGNITAAYPVYIEE